MTDSIMTILDNLDTERTMKLLNGIRIAPAPVPVQRRLTRLACARAGLRVKAPHPWWLIPVAAVLAAGGIVASVPDARAAVADFFDRLFRIERYMMADSEDRPQIEEIEAIIQTPAPTEASASPSAGENSNAQQAVFSDISADAPFLNGIDVHVTETLYDGEQLIINALITGDIGNLYDEATGDFSREYDVSPGDRITLTDADGNTQTLLATANLIPPYAYSEKYAGGANNPEIALEGLKLMITAELDRGADGQKVDKTLLKGMLGTSFAVTFVRLVQVDESRSRMDPIGVCTVSYAFDATAGSESIRTLRPDQTIDLTGKALVTEQDWDGIDMLVKNTELPLTGCAVKVDTVSVKPTGISARLLYRASDGWTELQRRAFLGGEGMMLSFRVIINGEDMGGFTSSSGGYDDIWNFADIDIPLTGDKQAAVETLEILPVVYHLTEVNGVAVTGEVQRIATAHNGEEGGWSQGEDYTALTQNRFTVELP